MKNISKPSRLASVLSFVLAVALTLTVVTGSGMTVYALSPQEKDEVSVLLRKGTEPITFTHAPFEGGNHIIYLPLRETLTAFGFAPEDITVDTQRSEEWEYYEQNGKEFGAPGTLLYSVIVISEQNMRKHFQAFTFHVCDQRFYLPVWDAVSTGPNALFNGNAVAVDGVTYVPYSILEYLRSFYPEMLADMNLTVQTSGCTIRLDTDINPYIQGEKAELTIERLTYLTQNRRTGLPFRLSDFAGFLPTREAGGKLFFDVTPTVTVSLEGTDHEEISEVWLCHGGENWSAINLNICSFDGYPWWGSDTWD